MQINVPEYTNAFDLNDDEKVLLSLVSYLQLKSKLFKPVTFVMHSYDVKRILNILPVRNHSLYIERVRKVLRIGMVSEGKWTVSLKVPDSGFHQYGRVISGKTEITNLESIKRYAFVAGRLQDPSLMEDFTHFAQGNERIQLHSRPILHEYFDEAF